MPYSRLFYHFVWATKNRQPLITDANRKAILAGIAAKVDDLGGRLYALNNMPDHVHLVASVPPTITLSAFVGQLKGRSSWAAGQLTPGDDSFTWQREYGVLSISERHLPIVVRYIQEQQQNHATGSLNANLENCTED